jgi:hypothetical protein
MLMTKRLPINVTGGLRFPRLADSAAERRVFPRRTITAEVLGKRIDHTIPALQHPSLKLTVRDLSLSGMSALSDTPLERGERLSVSFPSLSIAGGLRRAGGWDATGRVIRCEPSGVGYRVAVEFDTVPSAA